MTYDKKPTNSANSTSNEAKDQSPDRSPDTNSEQSEQIHDEDVTNPDGLLEIQSGAESIADPSSSITSSLDPTGSISSDHDPQFIHLNNGSIEDASISNGSVAELSEESSPPEIQSERRRSSKGSSKLSPLGDTTPICYNPALDDEIRDRLDKLNRLSDLINSLELQFDQANALFNETLKCSTEKLSAIAKSLGSKSIRRGRLYHAAKISVEETQSECQKACVQFEQANIDHQHAKLAIKEAESRLCEMNSVGRQNLLTHRKLPSEPSPTDIDIGNLKLRGENDPETLGNPENDCDNVHNEISSSLRKTTSLNNGASQDDGKTSDHDAAKLIDSAKLSEDLNRAINRLVEAEEKRLQSEKLHSDQANKLMIAQENLTKLEREHGASIRRAQVYFEEARHFNQKLNSVKSDITRVSEDIVAAKKAYAKTLSELEQFSEDLRIHIKGNGVMDPKTQSDQ